MQEVKTFQQNHLTLGDVTKKLITSTSSFIVEEPKTVEDWTNDFRDRIKGNITIPSGFRSIGRHNFPDSEIDEIGDVYALPVGVIHSVPKKVDLSFGKLIVLDDWEKQFSAGHAFLRDSKFLELIKKHYGDNACNNSGDMLLMGNAVYSWLSCNSTNGVPFIPEPGKDYHISRETRSQLPEGTYVIKLTMLYFVLIGTTLKPLPWVKASTVNISVQGVKDKDSQKKSNRSKKSSEETVDDVHLDLD